MTAEYCAGASDDRHRRIQRWLRWRVQFGPNVVGSGSEVRVSLVNVEGRHRRCSIITENGDCTLKDYGVVRLILLFS